ncbi:sulfotransferase 1 family member D1-like [Choristoneura fumiferana]|uniref:sulfotransferase 1 family member D1-like n=1 Tax=Choristoneura fumiferana TaxID=7141 RepID=UPI003D1568D5
MSEESVKIQKLPTDTEDSLLRLFKGHSEGFLQFGAGRFILPTSYREHAAPMRALPLRPDDVWVATFPRCGTTWTQELVWLVQNNLDYKKAAEISLLERYLFIELFTFMHEQLSVFEDLDLDGVMGEVMKTPGYIMAEKMPSPRFIKTHLPMSLLSPNLLDTSKVVYVARDPRDAAVSFYYHNKRFKIHDYVGDFKSYWYLFQKNLIPWSPFWAHVKEAWALRYHPNMLFMFYEDMLKDLPAAIKRVAKFFGKTYSEQQMRTLCEHLDFKNFKNNSSVNFETMNHPLINEGSEAFVRQGKAGGWAEHFDDDMRRQAREWVERHLQDTDLRFPQT